jgi:multidrug efflux pump subunit AcrA (membrane-fusion protein)
VGRKKPGRKAQLAPKRRITLPGWAGLGHRTIWDWVNLLILPIVLAVGGYWFTAEQDARQQRIEDRRAQQAQKIENQRAKAERKLAQQRAQDEALQAYLDQMGSLLLEKDLRASEEGSEVRTLARARTLTVLGRLDPSRKTAVMQFLLEAELVQRVEGGRGRSDTPGGVLGFAFLP